MLKILIADDSAIVRQLVKNVLSGVAGWSVCGEAANGQQAVSLARELKPDVIVLDMAMPELNGLQAAVEIRKFARELPILLYTLHPSAQLEVEAHKAAIQAVISKSEGSEALLKAVEKFAPQRESVSPELLERLGGAAQTGSEAGFPAAELGVIAAETAPVGRPMIEAMSASAPVSLAPQSPATSIEASGQAGSGEDLKGPQTTSNL